MSVCITETTQQLSTLAIDAAELIICSPCEPDSDSNSDSDSDDESECTLPTCQCRKPKFTPSDTKHYELQKDKTRFKSPLEEYVWAYSQFKECSKCCKKKRLVCFNKNTSSSDGFLKDGTRQRRPECAECTKSVSKGANEAKKLAKTMGIPYVAPPGTCCEICKKTASKGNAIVFDHCHKTNVFRGYLCNTCNRGLGLLGDDQEGIMKVLNYLKKSEN